MRKNLLFLFSCALLCISLHSRAQGEFITLWKTDNPGNTTSTQIRFAGTGTYSLYWEEQGNPAHNGTVNVVGANIGAGPVIDFGTAGTYIVKATGLTAFVMSPNSTTINDPYKLLEVQQWGTSNWKQLSTGFYNCINMDVTATDAPILTNLPPATLDFMFDGCKNLKNTNNSLNTWDVSNIKSIAAMFEGCSSFNQDLNNWNTANVTNMGSVFRNCTVFNGDITTWNTSSVINLARAFENADAFNRDIKTSGTAWNTAACKDFLYMFSGTNVFNQDISNWDVSAGINFDAMFANTTAFNQPLNSWNVANAERMSYMFAGAKVFNQPLNNWNTGKVKDMSSMFRSTPVFNQPLDNWDTHSVDKMGDMFLSASVFDQNLGSWNLSALDTYSSGTAGSSAFGMLNGSNLSCVNYSKTLIGWAANLGGTTPSGSIHLGSNGRIYSPEAQAARNALLAAGWTITNDALDALGSCTLPVVFGNVGAIINNGNIELSWTSLKETDNSHFEIEISGDGKNFKKVATVSSTAINGNSSEAINYSYIISNPTSLLWLVIPAVLGLGLLVKGSRNGKWLGMMVMVLAIGIGGYSCSKDAHDSISSATESKSKIYIRIAQVDKSGLKQYSRVVQAVNR